MALLEVRYRSGHMVSRELKKNVPLTVGRSPHSDIHVDADGVAAIHCRIAWNRTDYEVSAATPAGVQWNGMTIRNATLSHGDVLRVGDVDIALFTDRNLPDRPAHASPPPPADLPRPKPAETARPNPYAGPSDRRPAFEAPVAPPGPALSESELPLKPLSDEALVPPISITPLAPRSAPPAPDRPRPHPAHAASPAPPPAPPAAPAPARDVPRVPAAPLPAPVAVSEELDILDLDESQEALHTAEISGGAAAASKARAARSNTPGLLDRLRESWGLQPVRPGEQDLVRSPLMLLLSGGLLTLLLSAATLWLFLARETAQRKFDAAQSAYNDGLYAQSIAAFELYLKDHPRGAHADAARYTIRVARVEQQLSGSIPAWDRALTALEEFVQDQRDREEFADPAGTVRTYLLKTAARIARGAAESAQSTRQNTLLPVTAQAVRLLELYSPPDAPPVQQLVEIEQAVAAAETAIRQQDRFNAAIQTMDTALAANRPLAVYDTHRQLLDTYPAFASERGLAERVKRALEQERNAVQRDDLDQPALTTDHPAPIAAPLSLTRRTRTRSDETAQGDIVFAVAEDCCYGIEAVTGEPRWRRVIGLDAPFFPMPVSATAPALLVFDTRTRELQCLQQQTGQLLWRQPLSGRPSHAPLVHQGQVFQATTDARLYQLDVRTGHISACLKFSQPLMGTPVPSLTGDQLYVAGRSNVLYVLQRRPLQCERVAYLGQAAGAIQAPLRMLRAYLLVAENDRLDSTLLKLFDTTQTDPLPRPLATARVPGQVRDAPVLRGKQLFVASHPERVTAFTVSETGNANALTRVDSYQVPQPQTGPVFLTIGPDDQLWMASSALRRLQVTRENLQADKQQIAVGLTAQPVQGIGDTLFLGRRTWYSRAVQFMRADRQRMTGQWQTSLGAAIIGHTQPNTESGAFIAVTTLGDLFQITSEKLARGGFELQTVGQIPVPESLTTELRATRLADGRLAVHCGGANARVWIIGPDGAIQFEHALSAPLEADPVLFAEGLLLPLPGRLRLVSSRHESTSAAVEDLLLPIARETSPRWKQVIAIDAAQAIAVDDRGRFTQIQLRPDPVPHLAEVSHWDAAVPVDLPTQRIDDRIVFADSQSRLRVLDTANLDLLADTPLPQPPHALWTAGAQAFVDLAGERLACFDLAPNLQTRWELPLPGVSLAGPPLPVEQGLLLALRDGQIWLVDPATGAVNRKLDLQQPLLSGPERVGTSAVVSTLDGSLIPLKPGLE